MFNLQDVTFPSHLSVLFSSYLPVLQIIEACLVSLLTSVISFGLPLLRKCSPCPESDPHSDSTIECPRPPGMYGNYVNVRLLVCLYVSLRFFILLMTLFEPAFMLSF